MDRTIEFEANLICDRCEKLGAYDIMGDYYCMDCLSELLEEESNEGV